MSGWSSLVSSRGSVEFVDGIGLDARLSSVLGDEAVGKLLRLFLFDFLAGVLFLGDLAI
jgi:hypothetical protein